MPFLPAQGLVLIFVEPRYLLTNLGPVANLVRSTMRKEYEIGRELVYAEFAVLVLVLFLKKFAEGRQLDYVLVKVADPIR